MKRRIILSVSVSCLFFLTAAAQAPQKRQKPSDNKAAIDPAATTALNNMSGYLKTLKHFTIKSQMSRDEIVDSNMKIQKSASNEVNVELPDRLQARIQGDEQDLEFVYNGQTLTLYDRNKKNYAVAPTPPTIARTLDAIRVRYGIVFPLADLIYMAADQNLLQNITAAGYIGTSRVDDVECDHIAIRQPEVDWQVWIEKSKTPFPRKIVITSKTMPTQPQYIAKLTWDPAASIDSNLFTFTPPSDAVRIKFARKDSKGN